MDRPLNLGYPTSDLDLSKVSSMYAHAFDIRKKKLVVVWREKCFNLQKARKRSGGGEGNYLDLQ